MPIIYIGKQEKALFGVDKTRLAWYNRVMRNKETTMKNRTKTKAFVFDFDDTLAHTSAVEREGTEDRFAEFNDPSTILNGTPLELMDLAKDVYDEGHTVFILTARNKRIANAIAEFLSGFDIQAHEIHCIGEDSPEQGNVGQNVAKAKRTVLLSIIENHDVIYFFDDDEKNIELASELDCRARKV